MKRLVAGAIVPTVHVLGAKVPDATIVAPDSIAGEGTGTLRSGWRGERIVGGTHG